MRGLSKVFLMGNLTRDPDLRYTSGGAAVVSFTVASSRKFTTASGKDKEETTFVKVSVWGKSAQNCGKYLSKGSPVFVEGRLRTNNWETDDGDKRSSLEVTAENVQFLGQKPQVDVKDTSQDDEDEIPF